MHFSERVRETLLDESALGRFRLLTGSVVGSSLMSAPQCQLSLVK